MAYSTNVEQEDKMENKGIATIQNYMAKREIRMVAELVRRRYFLPDRYLLKDGSLEYQVHGISSKAELARFKNNYHFVVCASKSFDPAYCIDKDSRNNSSQMAQLPLYSRTPVQMYDSEEVDLITANIINERNPVCYSADRRWTNHLYPIYVMESYIKSEYLAELGIQLISSPNKF